MDSTGFDEPACHGYLKDAITWGAPALERAARGLARTTAVHRGDGQGSLAALDWQETRGQAWRQDEVIFPALAASSIQQVF